MKRPAGRSGRPNSLIAAGPGASEVINDEVTRAAGKRDGNGNVTKVLYIEHDDDNLYMLKMRLERYGHFEVLGAEESEKGFKLAGASGRNSDGSRDAGR